MTATTVGSIPPDVAPPDDPFRYGWRVVRRDIGDGHLEEELIPLRLIDLLHPEEGDQVIQNYAHQRHVRYLADVFQARVAGDPHAVVLADMRIAWDVPELKAHGPDVMVIFDVRELRNWGTFDVAQEGTRPAIIVEVTSPETRKFDLYDKVEAYDRAGVPLYIVVDAVERQGKTVIRLLGYERVMSVYQPLIPDERGWLWLAPLRIWLGVRDNEVYCFDEQGKQIGDYTELVEHLVEAEERAATAEERAATAEERAAIAEERAAAEAAARAAAEARVRALEAELRRLRGE